MSARTRRSACDSAVSSVPSNTTEPPVGGVICMTARPVVDLPQPDSPTMPERLAAQDVEADAGHGADGERPRHRELDDEVFDPQHDVAVAQVRLAGAGHQRVPAPMVSCVTISASRSSNSGDPTGYQQA